MSQTIEESQRAEIARLAEQLTRAKVALRILEVERLQMIQRLEAQDAAIAAMLKADGLASPDAVVFHAPGDGQKGRPTKLHPAVLVKAWKLHTERGVSPTDIAKLIGCTRPIIHTFLRRKYYTPAAEAAYRALGVKPWTPDEKDGSTGP